MSDVGRKMDVEDVLSSIRRLVSEEARTVRDTPKSADTKPKPNTNLLQESNETPGEKLVLTPSLRVTEAVNSAPAASEIERRIADIESLVMSEATALSPKDAVDHQIDDEAPMIMDADEFYDDEAAPAPASLRATRSDDGNPSEMMAALNKSMREFARAEPPLTANSSNAPSPSAGDNPEQEEVMQTLRTPIQEPETQEETEDAFVDSAENDFVPLEDAAAADEDAREVAEDPALQDTPETEADSPFTADLDDDIPEPAFLKDTQGEQGKAEHSTLVNREPDFSVTDLDADTDTDTDEVSDDNAEVITDERADDIADDDLDAETQGDLEDQAMNTTAQSGAASANRAPLFEEPVNYTEGEDAFLDEETLREMVSEMVRSELQGELGDRITRNVRKLVRREIFRALASREFE